MQHKLMKRSKRILFNIMAMLAGVVSGSLVNMFIVMISGSVIPPPEGADVTTMEGLKASMHLFGPKNFIMPFLAHAAGTFVGAIIAALVARNHHWWFAMGVGFFFLAGGVANTIMLPSPGWFTATDLILAYLPVAYLAGKLVIRKKD